MILNTKQYLGPCACGRDHELRTKLVVCEYGALERFEQYMDDCGLSGHRIVIYDTNTYNLPGMVHVRPIRRSCWRPRACTARRV